MDSVTARRAVVASGAAALAILSATAIRAGMTVGSDLGMRTSHRPSRDLALRIAAPTVLPPAAHYAVRVGSPHSAG